jgi:hypothetical protein
MNINKKIFLCGILIASLMFTVKAPDLRAQEPAMEHAMEASAVMTLSVYKKGIPLKGAVVIIGGQGRVANENGVTEFEHLNHGEYTATVISDGQTYTQSILVDGEDTSIDVAEDALSIFNAVNILLFSVVLLLLVAMIVIIRNKAKGKRSPVLDSFPKKLAILGIVAIILLTLALSILNNRALLMSSLKSLNKNDSSFAAEVSSIPQPKNVKVYADDRMATLTWDKVSGSNVVGYYIRWGKKSGGILTDSKQTIHNITQIQPLENGQEYLVQVQSVQGTITTKQTASEEGGTDKYATANGNLSLPTATSVTATSARVDAMKARLTGFFDDFNLSAGGFDETKWNHATTACVEEGEDGQFINSQFHAHNQTRSTCDRDGNISRPRAIFDISGRSETNPGQIEFDIDGVSQPRDVWYVDIIPADARKNGFPLDVTSHNDLFDADTEDPGRMIRITQYMDKLAFHYYDASNKPHSISLSKLACSTWDGGAAFQDCNIADKQTDAFSPIAQIAAPINPIPNVRRHWVIQFSPQKIKLFIDGALMAEGITPSLFSNITKYQIHSTLFSYNTGKQYNGIIGPTTSMLHWDNFGFNGPAPSVDTHNYIDGGKDGITPLIGTGTKTNPVPSGNRTTKIPILDPIGSPVGKARLMFTVQPFGYNSYTWSPNNSVTVNGKQYAVPDPRQNMQNPKSGALADTYVPLSMGVLVEPSDLVQGMNTVAFNLNSDILNAHIEIDYNKGSGQQFTQPRNIFTNLNGAIMPTMRANDSYWFVEQKMGLENNTGGPGPILSTIPTPVVTATPTNAATTAPTAISRPTSTPIVTPIPTAIPTPRPTATPVRTTAPTATPISSFIPTATPLPGTGNGLNATYYTGRRLINQSLKRVDPSINFNWGGGSPAAGIPNDNFSVRWEGYVLPRYNEIYTFYARTDDGVRVYIDNTLIINYWKNRAAAETQGLVKLEAGKKHAIRVEYFENWGQAVSRLFWSSNSQTREIVPQSQLFTQ